MRISVIGDTATGVSQPRQQSFSVCLGNGMHGKDIPDLCCVALGRWEQVSAYPDRDTMPARQSKDTIKVQHSEPKSFIGVTYWTRNDLRTAMSPKTHSSMGDSSHKLGTWSTLHSLQVAGAHCTACG